jgi:hypothetical protein
MASVAGMAVPDCLPHEALEQKLLGTYRQIKQPETMMRMVKLGGYEDLEVLSESFDGWQDEDMKDQDLQAQGSIQDLALAKDEAEHTFKMKQLELSQI